MLVIVSQTPMTFWIGEVIIEIRCQELLCEVNYGEGCSGDVRQYTTVLEKFGKEAV